MILEIFEIFILKKDKLFKYNVKNFFFYWNWKVCFFSYSGPIDGSEKYLKYIWYYQRYQPKYQISNNRTIILSNITEQMQGLDQQKQTLKFIR